MLLYCIQETKTTYVYEISSDTFQNRKKENSMLGKVIEIMFFLTVGTVSLLLPIMAVPAIIMFLVFKGTKHSKRNQKGE